MNATHMMIDPNELVIDMPVDEGNVKLKMESLQSSGMVQPVTVWLQDLRIIDGFHRTEAAKRLGWAEIPCNVIDCTEDAFWDARIQSAKQHHAIEAQRLEAWMLESWKATEWAEQDIAPVIWESICLAIDYTENIRNPVHIFSTLAGMPKASASYLPTKRELTESESNLLAWLTDKSNKWNITLQDLIGKIIRISLSGDDWNALAQKYNLSYQARLGIKAMGVSAVGWAGSADLRRKEAVATSAADKWLEEIVVDGKSPSKERLIELGRAYQQERLDAGSSELRARRDEELQKQQAARAQWEQTPQGQAAVEKQRAEARLSTLRYGVRAIKDNIESISHVVGSVPEAPAMLAELAQYLHDFIAKHLPHLETPDANPVALENAELRKENEALRDRVASLERALQSQESAGALLAGVVAWSSTDLDR